MNVIYIDTSDNKKIIVALRQDEVEDKIEQVIDNRRAQIVLPLIDALLNKHNLSVHDINALQINEGPGSFTGLRVGISIVNALGFVLNIPINGKKVGELIEPKYT
jgi:tRNA threonylcarbamoyladenosine biosynthesis protein TsaB